jgi:hypothetical protein
MISFEYVLGKKETATEQNPSDSNFYLKRKRKTVESFNTSPVSKLTKQTTNLDERKTPYPFRRRYIETYEKRHLGKSEKTLNQSNGYILKNIAWLVSRWEPRFPIRAAMILCRTLRTSLLVQLKRKHAEKFSARHSFSRSKNSLIAVFSLDNTLLVVEEYMQCFLLIIRC